MMFQTWVLTSGHFDTLQNTFVQEVPVWEKRNLTNSVEYDSTDGDNGDITPGLAIEVDYNEEGNVDDSDTSEKTLEDYTINMKYNYKMRLNPFTLHHPMHSYKVTEFEFSDWYFLFFKPVNKSAATLLDISSASSEVAASLSSKLSVPSSMFSINSLDKYKSNSISANLSLMSHSIPKLHHNLCNLQNKSPIFWIRGAEFRLVQIFHDKNQHLYINNKEVSRYI